MPKSTTVVVFLLSASVAWAGSAARQLSGMDQATRENAVIGLERPGVQTDEMLKAEYLWNSGRYAEAISAVEAMESDLGDMCLGISWRKPIETKSPKWGADVQVTTSSYDISGIELVKAMGNNNLFVLATGSFGADTGWTLNISTNGGTSWSETYRWNLADGFVMCDVDAAEYTAYIYVAYASTFTDSVFVRRFSETNGAYDNGFGFKVAVATNADIREVNLEPNRASWVEMYCGAINANGALLYSYSGDTGKTWNSIATGVTNARLGLDMDYGFITGAQHYLWLSYINTGNYLCVKARTAGVWEDHLNMILVDPWYSRIAQHGDTVMVLYADTGNLGELRCLLTYNDGANWYYATIYDSTDAGAFDITGRGGQGWQVAFCDYYIYASETMKYRRRNYSAGSWGNVQSFGNRDAFFDYNSSIDYLGSSGAYGVAYIDDGFDVWFDRIDWNDIVESAPRPLPMEFKALPGSGKTTLSFVLPQAGFASLKIYDVKGALVRDLSGNYNEGLNRVEFVPSGSGTFFAILAAGDQQARTKFTDVK